MCPPTPSDSQATSVFELVHLQAPKQTVGSKFYDRSKFSRMIGLVGAGFAALIGIICTIGGLVIFMSEHTISSGIVVTSLSSKTQKELLSLVLNLVVTACTEATGFVHGIALRSALASDKRLRFNTNLRLLSAASGYFNPNSTLWNLVMAILLIVSYSSSLLVALWVVMDSSGNPADTKTNICISEVPLIVLSVALLSQAVIAFACVLAAWKNILTWSSSPFDLTAALVHNIQITPEPRRCMRSICDEALRGPVAPPLKVPSAWRAHPSVKKVVLTLWLLVVVCILWGFVIAYLSYPSISQAFRLWSFLPQSQSSVIVYSIPLTHMGGVYWYWGLYYVNMAAIQGPLTLALHCSELVVNVIRDERMWRKATTEKGTTISPNPLVPVLGNPLNLTLLVAKPLLHWMLGLAISLTGTAEDDLLTAIAVTMWPSQILNYAAALLIVSLIFTTIGFLQGKGPQPAAYGHVQTLANLTDEFPSTGIMWWGDKECEHAIRHAGTSEHHLPEVDMNALYA